MPEEEDEDEEEEDDDDDEGYGGGADGPSFPLEDEGRDMITQS